MLDSGPFRLNRSSDRNSQAKPAAARKAADEEKVSHEPRSRRDEEPKREIRHETRHTPPPVTGRFNMKGLWAIIVAVILVLAAAVFAWGLFAENDTKEATSIDSGKYQAILLTNGEAYLGKLSVLNEHFMKLTDIYYLKPQADDRTETGELKNTTAEQSVQLIKFGGEVQGPEDEMLIAKDQILYYQNLKPDGKASKAIEEHKRSN